MNIFSAYNHEDSPNILRTKSPAESEILENKEYEGLCWDRPYVDHLHDDQNWNAFLTLLQIPINQI
jgi:hypothetical protein